MSDTETIRGKVGGVPVKLVVEFNEQGQPVDIVTAGYGKAGTPLDSLWRLFVLTWRENFKQGVPVGALRTLMHRKDESAGPTGNADVPDAGSLGDFFARSVTAAAERRVSK